MTDYLVHSEDDRNKLLKALDLKNIEEIFKFIPEKIFRSEINLPEGLSEKQLSDKIEKLANLNKPINCYSSFLGGGAYNHYVPELVGFITSISQFYTAYTPYQAEISQGTLQYIFEFQSLVCRLTGMEVANASMYDGGSALAEAVLLASRVTGKKNIVLASTVNYQYRQTLKTYTQARNMEIREVKYKEGITDIEELENLLNGEVCAVVIQNPNFFGHYEDVFKIRKLLDCYSDCLFIICTNPLTLALLKPPSEYGADIVVGEAQCFGIHLSFGGPYLGFFSTLEKYLKQIPGRIVGKTIDKEGKDAYVLTYQTREQHIRKTKATSNICSNHSLNALATTVYLATLGEEGLKKLADICVQRANYFSERLNDCNKFRKKFKAKIFNEMVISSNLNISDVMKKLYTKKIIGGLEVGRYYPELSDSILVSFTEMNSVSDIDNYLNILKTI